MKARELPRQVFTPSRPSVSLRTKSLPHGRPKVDPLEFANAEEMMRTVIANLAQAIRALRCAGLPEDARRFTQRLLEINADWDAAYLCRPRDEETRAKGLIP